MVLGWRHDDRAPEIRLSRAVPGRLRRNRAADKKCLSSPSEALEGFDLTRNRWQLTRMNRIDDAAARIAAGHLGGPWLHGLVEHLSLAAPSSQCHRPSRPVRARCTLPPRTVAGRTARVVHVRQPHCALPQPSQWHARVRVQPTPRPPALRRELFASCSLARERARPRES